MIGFFGRMTERIEKIEESVAALVKDQSGVNSEINEVNSEYKENKKEIDDLKKIILEKTNS